MSLYEEWITAKALEAAAVERRREIEDALVETLRVDTTSEGSNTTKVDGYKVRVTTRLSRKVDGDLLQEIAAEHGLSDHLPELFRWKPEVSIKAWKNADEAITRPLLGAITTTPGRPGFQITREED
jgi:hypothetical protein